MSTMRALIRTGPSKNTLTLDLSHPTPTVPPTSQTTYLICTHAVSLTRGELTWPEPLELSPPIPGYDFAGTVLTAPSSQNAKFKEGDEVYGMVSPFGAQGAAREICVVEERGMARTPRGKESEDAAAVPLSALSGWQALFVHGGLRAPVTPGGVVQKERQEATEAQRVLVTAASGGVGIWAVQLARLAGATVVGTCGAGNVEFVRELGAHEVLDYREVDVRRWVEENRVERAFDVVLDCVGGATLSAAWTCAREGGRVISVAEPADTQRPAEGVAEGVKGVWFIVEADGSQLDIITTLIEAGSCRGAVDRVFGLDEWEAAFERVESGRARGKVVLKL